MTIKEIEEQLKRVRKGNELIQRLQLKYQSLDNGLLSGSNQFTTRVSTSKTNNAENKLIETLELRDKIVEQIQAIMDERFEVLNMINQLDDVVENLVLVMLYVNNLPMAQVCKELDFSKVHSERTAKKPLRTWPRWKMPIDKEETIKQAYKFLKSYHSLVKLSLGGQDGAFEAKAMELLRVIEAFRDNLDDVRREIFANLFTRRTGERLKLWQIYETLDIDRAEYERLKDEILLDFAKSYRGGVLLKKNLRFKRENMDIYGHISPVVEQLIKC